MTIDHPLRRWLARVCSAETMRRVVDPTLADMRFEERRPTWRGYVALARALALHAIASAPGVAARVIYHDGAELARAAVLCALTTLVLTAPLVVPPMREVAVRTGWRGVVLLAPQAVVLALPASLLFAVPLAFRKTQTRRRVTARVATLSLLCSAATFVLVTGIMPKANQAFRVESFRRLAPPGAPVELERGPNELGLAELRDRIAILQRTRQGAAEARRLEYTYQLRFALSVIALPLGALGLSIARRPGRLSPLALAVAVLMAYVFGLFPLAAWLTQLLKRSEAISPAMLAWTPTVLTSLVAAVVAATSPRHASA